MDLEIEITDNDHTNIIIIADLVIRFFYLNLLLHSRSFLRFALIVESHFCLHASVNRNAWKTENATMGQKHFT